MLIDDLTTSQYDEVEALVARRVNREPLQHLTGRAYFRHVELQVGPGVFVPRPETELLAGWAVEACTSLSDPVVVDLCTGSGAVAKAVADREAEIAVLKAERARGQRLAKAAAWGALGIAPDAYADHAAAMEGPALAWLDGVFDRAAAALAEADLWGERGRQGGCSSPIPWAGRSRPSSRTDVRRGGRGSRQPSPISTR